MGTVWGAGAWASGAWGDAAWAEATAPPVAPIRFRGSLQAALEYAAALCCCQGSGSGSGGGLVIPCCDLLEFDPNTVSWEITGISCANADCLAGTETDITDPECQYLQENMPDGWELAEENRPFNLVKLCGDNVDVSNILRIELCCIRNITTAETQLWLSVSINFSHEAFVGDPDAWGREFRLLTNLWDFGGCGAGILEIVDRPLTLTGSFGVTTCTFPDPRISLVFT